MHSIFPFRSSNIAIITLEWKKPYQSLWWHEKRFFILIGLWLLSCTYTYSDLLNKICIFFYINYASAVDVKKKDKSSVGIGGEKMNLIRTIYVVVILLLTFFPY